MKSLKILAVSVLLATTSFSTVSFAKELEEVKKVPKFLPDWYWSADRIDPNNPDLENLPPSKVEFDFKNPNEISPSVSEPMAGGSGSSYIHKDGLEFYGTNATTADEVVVSYGIVGTLYKQAKNSTKLTQVDIDSDQDSFSKGVVIAETDSPGATVGTTMISEGIHNINLGLVNTTKVTTAKLLVK